MNLEKVPLNQLISIFLGVVLATIPFLYSAVDLTDH